MVRTTYRRVDVTGSRCLRVALFAAIAFAAPGLAHASTVIPDATYYNSVAGIDPNTYPSPGSIYASQTSYQATGGLAITGSAPPFAFTNYSASTSNDYNIPSVSARAAADSRVMAGAGSSLFYYVEFGSTTASTATMRVTAYGEATLSAIGAGGGAGTRSQNNAEVGMSIDDRKGNGSLVALGVSSDLGSNQGLQAFNFDEMVTFDTNVVYQILIRADVTAAYLHEGYAYVDPYFYVPDGITFSISNGIGNAPPNSATTPLPAALPLFAGGLGGLAYLARRRRKGGATA
jgi:hypothetical protein